jgi:peptide/nickel transport system permease protein
MWRVIWKRLAAGIPLVLGTVTLIFILMECAPGSPVDLWIGDRPVPPEVRDRLESAYGLDRGPAERYLRWITSFCFRGEMGWSFSRSRPVSTAIAETLPATLLLSTAALLVHLVVGIALGIWSATRRGRGGEIAGLSGLVLYAMPPFWLGMMAILLLAYAVPLFPPSSIHSVGAREWPWLSRSLDLAWHTALPAMVLGLSSAAGMARFVRAGLLEALGREFIRAARARGVGGRSLLFRHALRNAALPVINLLGLSLPVLVSGSLVIEVVFAWPGMGRMTYEAIRAGDFPLVLACTLLAAVFVIVGNLAADLAMAVADPRIRLSRRGGPS